MKLAKFAKLVKQGHFLYLAHVKDSGVWLGIRAGFYKASGLPDTVDEATILTILDFDSKAQEKIIVEECEFESEADMFGMNLSSDSRRDIGAKRFPVAAVRSGTIASALLCDDGDLVFYSENLLTPLADVFKESDYAELTVRMDERGRRYVVVRDGFETLAGFMPLQVITEEYLGELEDFHARCADQYFREENKKEKRESGHED